VLQEEDGSVDIQIQNIFTPSFLVFNKLQLNNQKILDEIKNLDFHQSDIHTENRPLMSNSMKVLEEIPEGNELKKTFSEYIDYGIRSVWRYNISHQIINSWVTKTYPTSESKFHTHKNFWLSAVYYPCNENNFKIKFDSPRLDLSSFDIPVYERNIYNSFTWTHTIKEGDLILFDAALRHKIDKNIANTVRYSIAMNILPKGQIGERDGTLVL